MNYAPLIRIAIRYIVGSVVGMDIADTLAGDPELVTMIAIGVGAATEMAYAAAVKKGWAK